jgi:uracil-DNA glycosylase family 4
VARVVRMNKRVYRQALLNTHYESYLRVLPNDEANFVPGDGDVMSPVVFIGEAPGEEEDRLGKPFIGRSGNLLTKLIKHIGMTREEVFITNLVKHRPPNNADPTQLQASAASALMRWELKILKPRVVVPLGRFASSVFYSGMSMQAVAGTCRQKDVDGLKLWVVPMYHPAAGLRSSVVRGQMYEHIQLITEALER